MVDAAKAELWKCGNCGAHYHQKSMADHCCSTPTCAWEDEPCDAPRKPGSIYCEKHTEISRGRRRHERLMKAEPVEFFIDTDSPVCMGDHWYFEIETLVDEVDEWWEDPQNCPEWEYCAKWVQFGVDFHDCYRQELENFAGDMENGEDADWEIPPHLLTELQELGARINAWFVEKEYGCWMIDWDHRFNLRAQVAEYLAERKDADRH